MDKAGNYDARRCSSRDERDCLARHEQLAIDHSDGHAVAGG